LILFQYDEDYDLFGEFYLSKYHIAKTPAIIIKCGVIDTLIDSKTLFSYGYMPQKVKEKVSEIIKFIL
jgi:hypothetical protein